MKKKKHRRDALKDSRGFSLLEVLLGISVFMIGMLGVTALNISSLKSNTYSGNLSEATLIAATKIEEFMAMDFDDVNLSDVAPFDGTDQDANKNGIDDDDEGTVTDGIANFGLDDIGDGVSDHHSPPLGKNGIYTVYWNVAVGKSIPVTPPRTKTINVIVEWKVKDEPRRINMEVVRMKEE